MENGDDTNMLLWQVQQQQARGSQNGDQQEATNEAVIPGQEFNVGPLLQPPPEEPILPQLLSDVEQCLAEMQQGLSSPGDNISLNVGPLLQPPPEEPILPQLLSDAEHCLAEMQQGLSSPGDNISLSSAPSVQQPVNFASPPTHAELLAFQQSAGRGQLQQPSVGHIQQNQGTAGSGFVPPSSQIDPTIAFLTQQLPFGPVQHNQELVGGSTMPSFNPQPTNDPAAPLPTANNPLSQHFAFGPDLQSQGLFGSGTLSPSDQQQVIDHAVCSSLQKDSLSQQLPLGPIHPVLGAVPSGWQPPVNATANTAAPLIQMPSSNSAAANDPAVTLLTSNNPLSRHLPLGPVPQPHHGLLGGGMLPPSDQQQPIDQAGSLPASTNSLSQQLPLGPIHPVLGALLSGQQPPINAAANTAAPLIQPPGQPNANRQLGTLLTAQPSLSLSVPLSGSVAQLGTATTTAANTEVAPTAPTPRPASAANNPQSNHSNTNAPEYFPEKLYRLLIETEEAGKDPIISFMPSGKAFRIHQPKAFMREIAPHYFKHKKIHSLKRQLNHYKFETIYAGPERGAYRHKFFRKGRCDLLNRVRRLR